MSKMASTSTSCHLNTDIKPRGLSLVYETPLFQKNSQKQNTENQEITVSRKKVIFNTKHTETSKTVHNVYKKTPWGKENIPPNSTSTSSSICSSRTVKKAEAESYSKKVTKKNQASAETAANSATDKKRSFQHKKSDEYPVKYGKRKIEYTDNDYESDEEDEYESDDIENKAYTSESRKLKHVKLLNLETPTVSYVYLFTKDDKMMEFPVFLEKDLKYCKNLSEVLRETELDNDCETDNEILEHSILQAKKDLVKGIEMQRSETKVKKTAIKEKPATLTQEDKATNDKQRDTSNKEGNGTSDGFWTKVSRSFNTLFSP